MANIDTTSNSNHNAAAYPDDADDALSLLLDFVVQTTMETTTPTTTGDLQQQQQQQQPNVAAFHPDPRSRRLWILAHVPDMTPAQLQRILDAFVAILVDRANVLYWLERCVQEIAMYVTSLMSSSADVSLFVLHALHLIRAICGRHHEKMRGSPASETQAIRQLEAEFELVQLVASNLEAYMERTPIITPESSASHANEIQRRLDFIAFCLTNAHESFDVYEPLRTVWTCLVQSNQTVWARNHGSCSAAADDRDLCFRWIGALWQQKCGDWRARRKFFEDVVLCTKRPLLASVAGVECFKLLYRDVNGGREPRPRRFGPPPPPPIGEAYMLQMLSACAGFEDDEELEMRAFGWQSDASTTTDEEDSTTEEEEEDPVVAKNEPNGTN